MHKISDSELILNPDGSVFHLHLKPQELAPNIILVGDPDRVDTITQRFRSVEVRKVNREFVSHTGTYNNTRITVCSTGIGTDNIDIVLTELDALANINFETRTINTEHKKLRFVRIGTSGALQAHLNVDTPVVARMACGLDGLLNFYAHAGVVCNREAEQQFVHHVEWLPTLARPYIVSCSDALFAQLGHGLQAGITLSAPGFYGPQGRVLRLPLAMPQINQLLPGFSYQGLAVTNYEMECSAIFGLAKLLGHEAIGICNIIANRMQKTYSKDYRKALSSTIDLVLQRLTQNR